jgi:hypothetical protein
VCKLTRRAFAPNEAGNAPRWFEHVRLVAFDGRCLLHAILLNMIMRILRIVALGGTALLGVLVTAYGVLALVSLHKEPLQPEVAAYLQTETVTVAPDRNGFYYWTGLNAPAGADPIEHGRRAIAALRRQPAGAGAADPATGDELRLAVDQNLLCNKPPCLPAARQNAAQLREVARSNAEMLRRYAALMRLGEFATDYPVLDPTALLPAKQDQISLFRLARTLDAVGVTEGHFAEAIEQFAARVRFARRMHANSGTLLDRMIAQALLAKDLELLAEVAASAPGAAKAVAATIATIAAPMTAAERSPARWMRLEFANKHAAFNTDNPGAWRYSTCEALLGNSRMFDLMMADKLEERCARWDVRTLARLAAPLMDRNAVANQLFEPVRQLQELSAPDAYAYLSAFLLLAAQADAQQSVHWTLGNTAGAVFRARLTPNMLTDAKSYHLSAIDLDRLYALTRVAVAIADRRVTEKDLPEFLKRSANLDPATREPFLWDSTRRQIHFLPLDRWIAANGRVGGIDGRVGLSPMVYARAQ